MNNKWTILTKPSTSSVSNSLGIRINHLNRHGLHPGNSRSNLTGKHPRPIINGPVPDQKSLGHLGNLPVEGGHDVGKSFDEGDFASEGSVDVREFESDVSRSDDGDPFGYRVEFECPIGGVDGFFVDGDSGWYEGDGAGGEDDILRLCSWIPRCSI